MTTLRSIREALNLSTEEVARRGSEIDAAFPTTGHAVYNIERRGTDSYVVLRVFSIVYGVPLAEIALIARPENRPYISVTNSYAKP